MAAVCAIFPMRLIVVLCLRSLSQSLAVFPTATQVTSYEVVHHPAYSLKRPGSTQQAVQMSLPTHLDAET